MLPFYLSLAILAGGDCLTTDIALARGGRESWLPTQNPFILNAAVAGATTAQIIGLQQVRKTHPRLATSLAIAFIVIRGAVVIHNVRQLRR
jgi:hypothetical protein